MDYNSKEYIKILNSYKMGVVPFIHINPLETGRDKEINELNKCLTNTSKGVSEVKVISGSYGSGKTFLLNMLKKEALNKDFIVSYIHIKKGFNLNNLNDFYYNLMHNLFVKSREGLNTSFDDLFNLWINNLQNSPFKGSASKEISYVVGELERYNSAFARAFLTYIRAKIQKKTKISNTIMEWITGEKNIPYELKQEINLVGQINNLNSLDFLKAFIKLIDLMGYKGLVILIDEFDLLINENITIRNASYQNLRLLIDLISSSEIEKTFLALTTTNTLLYDEEKGFKSYPALSQRLGINTGTDNFTSYRSTIMKLTPLSFLDFKLLAEKIAEVYSRVYPLEMKTSAESLKNWVLLTYQKEGYDINNLSIRLFVIKYIEILDVVSENPNNQLYKKNLAISKSNGKYIFKNTLIS
ncbi:BREX system ATP-binding domain-containing protein [Helicovermis profundi]|uniref:DUF2791 family P-loop domain-containing protein n=1 Tax=Helicovermis profundi TaxID=3065157 RepID=A0AAU9ELA0_9FIRM|nr:DUF2791 family P-loop domain-containing protein [Clostridia bacterium S502]